MTWTYMSGLVTGWTGISDRPTTIAPLKAVLTITFNLVNKIKSCLDSLASSTEGRDAAVDTDSGVEVNPSPVKG